MSIVKGLTTVAVAALAIASMTPSGARAQDGRIAPRIAAAPVGGMVWGPSPPLYPYYHYGYYGVPVGWSVPAWGPEPFWGPEEYGCDPQAVRPGRHGRRTRGCERF
jgi:hypothetical protein